MGPLQDIWETWARFWQPENPAVAFLQARWRTMVAVSAVVLVPCFWHRRIEAGDLGSHVYNAWLAQLIGKDQAPGLYLAHQWNNMLFDVALLHTANVFGFAAAQRIVVSACVLIFFLGVFALVSAVTGKAPIFLTPCIAMLAYGYSFEMGFMNYYLSIGLACFSLAIFVSAKRRGWIVGLVIAALVYMAHPVGFLWLAATWAYLWVRHRLTGGWRAVPFLAGLAAIYLIRWELLHRAKFEVDWDKAPFYLLNGADQLAIYSQHSVSVAWVALLFGIVCFLLGVFAFRREKDSLRLLILPLELYLLLFFATALFPENIRPTVYDGWIGLIVSRLTTISAIVGLCVLGTLTPKKWHLAGFGVLALFFFTILYQDTAVLNETEANAERLVSTLPYGTRVTPTLRGSEDSRITFIGHLVDRACIGHCFTYSNYEPSSGQFRVRVRQGSPLAMASADDAEDLEGGSYQVQSEDLPLKQVYQCDSVDPRKLCLYDLSEGDTTGPRGMHAPTAPRP